MRHRRLRRPLTFIDMMAMCDVAFIVLIFFIVSTKPKQWLPVKVNLPVVESNHSITEWGDNCGTILIGQNKVMLALPETIRLQVLKNISAEYHIEFSEQELKKFLHIQAIGVPVKSLKAYIDNYYNAKAYYSQPGIDIDGADNELSNWIGEAQKASKSSLDEDLHVLIEADRSTPYSTIGRVTDVLNHQHIFKYSLLYNEKSITK